MSHALPRLLEPEHLRTPQPGVLVVQVADAAAYHQAHLPGAVLVEPRDLVSGKPPVPGRLPDRDQLERLFSRIGYRPDLHIVACDDEGGGWAGRLIWTLDVIGHDAWSYLNGGVHAWRGAGLPLDSGPGPEPAPTPVALTIHREPIADRDDVQAAIGDAEQIIWDVRSPAEYRGERSGSRRAGHVPTALNLDWSALKDPSRDLRLAADLPALLARHGIDASKQVITHCQTHHRSGLSYLVGRLLGFRGIRGYHGSWAEWGNLDDTPIATGDAPGSASGEASHPSAAGSNGPPKGSEGEQSGG